MENEIKKIACIDADSICYICSKETIRESLDSVDSIIIDILMTTNADSYIMCLSDSPYFRSDFYPEYKSNRKNDPSLKYLKVIKNYLIAQYGAMKQSKVEADDLVAYFKINGPSNLVICTIDKDVLGQIPGTHYNYKKREWITTSNADSNYNFYLQVIMGDAGDNIKGVPGLGDKKSRALLDASDIGYEEAAIFAYKRFYGDSWLHNYYTNYNLVYLLKTKEDYVQWNLDIPTANIVEM